MIPALATALRTMLAAGTAAARARSAVIFRDIFTQTIMDIAGTDSEGGEGKDTQYNDNEAYRLAKAFERILKQHLRVNIFKTTKNSPFTQVLKGGNSPLRETGDLENFIEIKKRLIGYSVGFNLEETHPKGLGLIDLLNTLENGKNISNGDTEKRRAISKYIWYKLNENGIKSDDIGFGKKKKRGRPKVVKPNIIIPPRPFFNRLVNDFERKNGNSNTVFTQGTYSLSIVVYKKK